MCKTRKQTKPVKIFRSQHGSVSFPSMKALSSEITERLSLIKIMILVRMEDGSRSKKPRNENIGKITSMKIKFELR